MPACEVSGLWFGMVHALWNLIASVDHYNPQNSSKYSLFWDLHRAILLTQRETLAAHNCEGTEQLHKIIINSILLLTY